MYSDVYVGNAHDKRFYGIYRGVVADNNDPLNKNRIRMLVPQILGEAVTGWASSIVNFPNSTATTTTSVTINQAEAPAGAFQDALTQTAVSSTTAYPILLRTTDVTKQVSVVSNSRITFSKAGIYNLQWSGQFQNTDTGDHDVRVWLRKNSTDIDGSTGLVSIPSKHGSVNGHTVVGWNYFVEVAAGQYIQMMWQSDSDQVTLQAYSGGTTPTTPDTASVIVTADYVGWSPATATATATTTETLNGVYRPSPGDGCWVMFEGGDPNFPLWLGAF